MAEELNRFVLLGVRNKKMIAINIGNGPLLQIQVDPVEENIGCGATIKYIYEKHNATFKRKLNEVELLRHISKMGVVVDDFRVYE
jgi:hypothetical protein